jgi:hypothetical protein
VRSALASAALPAEMPAAKRFPPLPINFDHNGEKLSSAGKPCARRLDASLSKMKTAAQLCEYL